MDQRNRPQFPEIGVPGDPLLVPFLLVNWRFLNLRIMKKQLLFLVAMLLPMVANADDSGKCGENLTWTYVETTKMLIISGTGEMVVHDNLFVPWGFYHDVIERVVIEEGVTTIGKMAFSRIGISALRDDELDPLGYTSLKVVSIPNSVTRIENTAFEGCSSLTSIDIPYSVTSIGSSAFKGCSGLTSISIPSSVTTIGESAFSDCTGLTSITIPDNVTSIGESVLSGCSGLTSIIVGSRNAVYDSRDNCNAIIETQSNHLLAGCQKSFIPKSVTSIGSSAFSGCSGLTSITIPNGVASIGRGAFWMCSSLASITIPNSVTSIGRCAFYGCSGLASITIPNSVTSIDHSAFEYCSSLTSVDIPNSVTSIGRRAFAHCNLKNVVLGKGIKSIKSGAFWGNQLEKIICYAENVPELKDNLCNTFLRPNLYVPAEMVKKYEDDFNWDVLFIVPLSPH